MFSMKETPTINPLDEMKDIKDYLHLYLGQDAYVFPDDTITDGWLDARLKEIPNLEYKIPITLDRVKYIIERGYKPILRPLSDMTEEERIYLAGITAFNLGRPSDDFKVSSDNEWSHPQVECGAYYGRVVFHPSPFTICYYNKDNEPREYSTPEIFRWLLSKGFDLFGLIEAGLAIDKTTLTVNQ